MNMFLYRGYDQQGNRRKGTVSAHSLKDARDKLARSGVLTETVTAATDASTARPPLRDEASRTEFYRALGALLGAGLPLAAALDVLLENSSGEQAADLPVIAGARDRIRDGAAFVAALREAGVPLSAFEAAALEAGERAGRLAGSLEQVADFLDDMNQVRQGLKTAMIYPLIMVTLSLVVGVGVMGFLVPQMATVFQDAGMDLPVITRLVVGAGRWFFPVILPAMLLAIWLVMRHVTRLRNDPAARIRWEQRAARMPLLRKGFQWLMVARFSRTSAMLLQGGVPVVDAMALAGRATGSVWLAGVLADKTESVRHGQSFSQALAETPVLGPCLDAWVRAGEASGDLAGMFQHAASRYQALWSTYLKRVTAFVEPALIMVVAVFVLLVALSILLPILELNRQI